MSKQSRPARGDRPSAFVRRYVAALFAICIGSGWGAAQGCSGIAGATSPAFCFVSQIGDCAALPAFLAANQPALA